MSIRRVVSTGVLGLAVMAGSVGVLSASPAAAIAVPSGVAVARQGDDLSTLAISWRAVTGAARYTVTVFDGTNQNSYAVPADQTTFSFKGNGVCTRYQVKVTSVDAAGVSAESPSVFVTPLAPGGITNLQSSRTSDGSQADLSWGAPPAGSSFEPVSTYQVIFRKLSDNSVVMSRDSAATTLQVTGLEAARAYVAEILPVNRFGSCSPSKVLVRGPQPSQPQALTVVRDTNDSQMVNVAWQRPSWTGYGPLTKMQIGVRNPTQRNPTWVDVPADATSASVRLPNTSKWSIWVRGVNGQAYGEISKEFFLAKPGDPGTPAIDPKVSISETDGVVRVTFDGPVGTSDVYPNMSVAIAATTTDTGFAERQNAFNRAQVYTFDKVPCGAFTVTVTGYGPNASAEFGRRMINRCNTGAVAASQWKLVYGRANIAGNAVDLTYGNEARVISTVPRTDPDMVYSTDATLVSGWGYGIWTRATIVSGAAASGYSFQYDPGYENVNPGFGKALLLRVWQNGAECGTPIAKVKWPTGLDVNATHKVVVVTKGDSLYATIDGIKMFDVPSLQQALAASKCNMAAPTGSQVGFRAWSAEGKATFRNTTIN